jgi:hypothetical protein
LQLLQQFSLRLHLHFALTPKTVAAVVLPAAALPVAELQEALQVAAPQVALPVAAIWAEEAVADITVVDQDLAIEVVTVADTQATIETAHAMAMVAAWVVLLPAAVLPQDLQVEQLLAEALQAAN